MVARLTFCVGAMLLFPWILALAQDAPPEDPKPDWTDTDAGREFVLRPNVKPRTETPPPAKAVVALEGDYLRADFTVSAAMDAGPTWIERKQRVRVALRVNGTLYSLEYFPFCESGTGIEAMNRCRVAAPLDPPKGKLLHGGIATVTAPEQWQATIWVDLKAIALKNDTRLEIGLAWGTPGVGPENWAFWPKPDDSPQWDDSRPKTADLVLRDLKKRDAPEANPVLAAHSLEAQLLAYYVAAGRARAKDEPHSAYQILETATAAFPGDPALAHSVFELARGSMFFQEIPKDALPKLQRLTRLAPASADRHCELMRSAVQHGQPEVALAAWRFAQPLKCWSSDRPARNRVECAGALALAAAGLFEECLTLKHALRAVALSLHEGNELKATAEQALMGGSLATARELFDVWHAEAITRNANPELSNRIWWVRMLSETGYGAEALVEAEAQLKGEIPGQHAIEYVNICIRAANESLDPPEAAARLREIESKSHPTLADKRREEVRGRAEDMDKHAQDWSVETAARIRDSAKQNPKVTMVTTRGTIVFELFEDDAPNTVANFVQVVREGFYTGRAIYRHEPDWLVQAGGKNDSGADQVDWGIANEANTRQHWRGTIAMARMQKPDTASTHFFVSTSNSRQTHGLGTDWVVFGRTVQGLDVLQRLRKGDRILSATASKLRDHPYLAKRHPVK